MEDVFKDPVQLSKGINMNDLLKGQSEFHIDIDFKKKSMGMMVGCDDDLFPDMDEDGDLDDPLKTIELSAQKKMLSCPEYHSFSDMASKMVDCIPSGDVKMLIIEEGDGPLVPVDATVTIHYAAYFEKTSIAFDSSLTMNNGAPLRINLGAGRFLPGLEIGLTAVKGPRARFHLLLQPTMAWGKFGVLPRIRPEPALFVIVLYKIEDMHAAKRFNDLSTVDQRKYEVTMRTVKSLHAHAKDLFARKKYPQAIKDYQQSIHILNLSQTNNDEEEKNVKLLKVSSYMNLAVCYYKIKKPKHILNMCDALDYIIDTEKHCKALFYYGRAHEMLSKQEEAIKYYKKALTLEPKNKEIGDALANLDKYNLKSAVKEKELWQKAFQSSREKKKVLYNVDEDFRNSVMEMCQNLAGRNEYSEFDLPNGLTCDEVECIKDLCSNFEALTVLERGEGKKISIVKKLSP